MDGLSRAREQTGAEPMENHFLSTHETRSGNGMTRDDIGMRNMDSTPDPPWQDPQKRHKWIDYMY